MNAHAKTAARTSIRASKIAYLIIIGVSVPGAPNTVLFRAAKTGTNGGYRCCSKKVR
jgi:hypothetical protein